MKGIYKLITICLITLGTLSAQLPKTPKIPQTPKIEKEKSKGEVEGKIYYVSANRGSGREGTKENPAKDLSSIISLLKPGDVVYIAQGVYTGKMGYGSDKITVPVSIIGGFNDDFTERDPWGKYLTIFSGKNTIDASTEERLNIETSDTYSEYKGKIVVDGIIFDNGPRNQYKEGGELIVVRKADQSKGLNATPSTAALRIKVGKYTDIEVRNCIALNVNSTSGVFSIFANKGSNVLIENNLLINNSGEAIYAMTLWHNKEDMAKFKILNNTILFSWKYEPLAESYSGTGIKCDKEINLHIEGNVIGFCDIGGFDNIKKAENVVLKNNLFTGNRQFDYREFNTMMKVSDIADYAEALTPDSKGNISEKITVPVNEKWANYYANRKEISRAQVEANVKAENSDINAIRSMLGLPLVGTSVKVDVDVWLHRLPIEDALKVGSNKFLGKYGCSKP